MIQKEKIIVNSALYDYIMEEVHFKRDFGTYVKDLYFYYRLFCAARGVSPLGYKDFRASLSEVIYRKMPEVELTKKNNRYFIKNVVHGVQL